MKNNLLRVLIGIVTVGLLAGCTAKPENTAQQNTTQTNQSLSDVSPKIQSLERFQSCVKMSVKTCEESNAKEQAKNTNDLSWCDLLGNENAKKMMPIRCYL